MQLPNLDEATRKALNGLALEEITNPYDHEILWYGIDAIAHVHLMQMAKDISGGRLSLEEFIQKYSLNFERSEPGKYAFIAPLKKIESDGIFIPLHAYWGHDGKMRDRRVRFFHDDYGNRMMMDSWFHTEYAKRLINRKWQPSDLENPELAEQGVRFGRDMWNTCVEGFNEHRIYGSDDAREKLVAYYSALVPKRPLCE